MPPFLLALSLSAVMQPAHPCTLWQEREARGEHYNPNVGVPVVGFFCGLPAGDVVDFDFSIDGIDQPSPGRLVLMRFDYPYWPSFIYPAANENGLVPYGMPEASVILRTPGVHTIRVTYGGRTATYKMIGVTPK
jgi:hypothetical protein